MKLINEDFRVSLCSILTVSFALWLSGIFDYEYIAFWGAVGFLSMIVLRNALVVIYQLNYWVYIRKLRNQIFQLKQKNNYHLSAIQSAIKSLALIQANCSGTYFDYSKYAGAQKEALKQYLEK